MSLEIAAEGFFAVTASVIACILFYCADRFGKKIDPSNKQWWLVPLIAMGLLILYGLYLYFAHTP